MISIDDIKGRNITDKLLQYDGDNPYILKLKAKYPKTSNGLTKSQIEYLYRNIDNKPLKVDRIVGITKYLGDEFQKVYKLTHTPERVLVETILGDTEKAIHVIGKVFRNQKEPVLFWLPKTQLLDDPYSDNKLIDIDFDKYNLLDGNGNYPYPHQLESIRFFLSRKKCILGDGMGLGKTKSAILSTIVADSEKVLIICPSTLKLNWEREINLHNPNTSVVSGMSWKTSQYTIINYSILKNFHTLKDGRKKYEDWEIRRELVDEGFDTIIVDEAHYLKNHKSKRGKIVRELIEQSNPENVWLLTGTPVANRPMDYYNLLKLIGHKVSDNWMFYARRYCEGRQITVGGRKRWLTNGASNLEELSIKTKNTFLRRTKDQELDLPDKIVQPVYITLENKAGYNSVFKDYKEKVERESDGKKTITQQLTESLLLRKFISIEKVPHTIELADNILEEDKKVIIFTNFNDEMDMFIDHYKNSCVYIRGGMSAEAKQSMVDRFQNDPKVKVFIGNIKAAGVGITLTKAEVVIMNSLDWVPGNHEQAEDRAYRIGQTKNVHIYYPLFDNTIDTYVWSVLKTKKDVIGTLVENRIEDTDMDEIIKYMKDY